MEVINAKYNDFVGLSGQLGGVEGAIVRMAKPLTELKVQLWVGFEVSGCLIESVGSCGKRY